MDAESRDSSLQVSQPPTRPPQVESSASPVHQTDASGNTSPLLLSASGISSWARNLKLPQSLGAAQENLGSNSGMATLSRLTGGLGLHLPTAAPTENEGDQGTSAATQSNVLESITKGLLHSSRSAVKAVQVKARHMVSQNKRRYQEGGFDLDMTYITDNIIAMGFPAGDISSGIFGYFEGFYRNHMEEVIRFFEMHHEGKYKVYNLCAERLYDASLFKGKVASFPFDDHNCPPLQLILAFCQSASSWLEEDKNNVVVVHCKAGMARTGLMVCSLLLYVKIFPTAEEAIAYYNQKRCTDGKALVLPSQIRYTTYFARILTSYNGLIPPGRRCMLRGFRLHKCPYWIRPAITISNHTGVLFSTKKHPKTKDLMPEDFWIKVPKKGIIVFAIPGEPGLTDLAGDFKIHFHERQGDFYCWLNTTMMENRIVLSGDDLDGFEKRKLPSPGLQLEVVMIDYDGTLPAKKNPDGKSSDNNSKGSSGIGAKSTSSKDDDDDVFSDSEGEESGSTNRRQTRVVKQNEAARQDHTPDSFTKDVGSLTQSTDQISIRNEETMQSNVAREGTRNDGGETASGLDVSKLDSGVSDFKAIAADASVFTFGDEEDYESD